MPIDLFLKSLVHFRLSNLYAFAWNGHSTTNSHLSFFKTAVRMSAAQAQITRMMLLLLTCLASTTLFGCAQLFNRNEPEQTLSEQSASAPKREAIVLDVALADRRVDDSLVKLLWDDVDEIGVLDVARKRLLNANGFRVGVAGSSVPSALQTILRESGQQESEQPNWNNASDQLPGSSVVTLFDGQDTLFEVTSRGALAFTEVDENGEPREDAVEYELARCVIRLTAEKMQDGWIKLRFLPEIHHGANANRPMVGSDGLHYKKSQRIEKLYRYQFEITLNPGEIAIVGASDTEDPRPGRSFLTKEGEDGLAHKLITVRFMKTDSVVGVRDVAE